MNENIQPSAWAHPNNFFVGVFAGACYATAPGLGGAAIGLIADIANHSPTVNTDHMEQLGKVGAMLGSAFLGAANVDNWNHHRADDRAFGRGAVLTSAAIFSFSGYHLF